MSSLKCPQCGLNNFADAEACRRCGGSLANAWRLGTGSLVAAPVTPGFAAQGAPPASPPPRQPANSSFQPPSPHQGFSLPRPEPQTGAPYAGVPFNAPAYPNAQYEGAAYAGVPYFAGQPVPYGYAAPSPKLRQGMAVASLVLGCVGLGACFLVSPVGIVLGIVATVKASRHPEEYGRKGMAIGGIVLNAIATFLVIPLAALITIPNLIAARIAANEASAIGTLRLIATAEAQFQSTTGKGARFGTLKELMDDGLLVEEGLVDMGSSLKKSGYRFEVRTREHSSSSGTRYKFEVVATPESYGSSGRRSFYVSDDYLIRAADKEGREATANDRVVEPDDAYDTDRKPSNRSRRR